MDTRTRMEPVFAHDFSHVRIHTDAIAAESARSVSARAYTIGSDIVFGAGEYQPRGSAGKRLLAHELAHVVQQDGNGAPRMLMRAAKDDTGAAQESGVCGGGDRTCASSNCEQPDPGHEGNGEPATSWKLKVLIDIETQKPSDVSLGNVGHTYVELSDSTNRAYTYGFYPEVGLPLAAGCVVHPDRVHEPCVDHEESFDLSESAFQTALAGAQSWCKHPPMYDVAKNNCTTFAKLVANVAGQTLPSGIGGVGPKELLNAESPNRLYDAIKRRDTYPTYNLIWDTDLREALANADPMRVAETPEDEKVRVVDRLFEGWLSDADIDAIEKIYTNAPASERPAIKSVVRRWLPKLTSADQAERVRKLIGER